MRKLPGAITVALCAAAVTMLLSAGPALAADTGAKRAITPADLEAIHRVAEPEVSPDGAMVAFTEAVPDVAANKTRSHIWIVPVAGGEPRQLTSGGNSEWRPRWSADGKTIAFVSDRGGTPQIWTMRADGADAKQLTSLTEGADGETWSARGNALVFTSAAYPECGDEACNREKAEQAEHSPARARIIEHLLFRHWDAWRDGKYMHTFVVPAGGGTPRDLTPGAYDSPTFFLDAPDQYALAPDGSEICVTSNRTGHPAWTTNNDLYTISASGGAARDITAANPGSDATPAYSPDGRFIAYTSQARNGYESDLFRLRVYDRRTGRITQISDGFQNWVENVVWGPDSRSIYFESPIQVDNPVYRARFSIGGDGAIRPGPLQKVVDGFIEDFTVAHGGRALIVTRSSLAHPSDLYKVTLPEGGGTTRPNWEKPDGKTLVQLTHANDALLSQLDLRPARRVWVAGTLGARIQSMLVEPPGFDATKKYPAIVLIHGGPQSNWTDSWGYRWNPALFAARGYVVMMTNYHGSTGYGQKFVQEISGDWGGAPYRDLMLSTDWLARQPYVMPREMGAAGASYGGYMIDWIAGHTQRFKALVSHDGVYDLRSMYGETEELWFAEWEFKGVPWEHHGPESPYQRWSPSNFVQNVRTPTLLIEGGHDYRVPEGQAFQFFTALRRRGIPSKLVYFPHESHFVLGPADSELWYKTVLDWLDKWVRKASR
jgi:dipeptidyl aminopeptidase/acylaminoacyl peptidase